MQNTQVVKVNLRMELFAFLIHRVNRSRLILFLLTITRFMWNQSLIIKIILSSIISIRTKILLRKIHALNSSHSVSLALFNPCFRVSQHSNVLLCHTFLHIMLHRSKLYWILLDASSIFICFL